MDFYLANISRFPQVSKLQIEAKIKEVAIHEKRGTEKVNTPFKFIYLTMSRSDGTFAMN